MIRLHQYSTSAAAISMQYQTMTTFASSVNRIAQERHVSFRHMRFLVSGPSRFVG